MKSKCVFLKLNLILWSYASFFAFLSASQANLSASLPRASSKNFRSSGSELLKESHAAQNRASNSSSVYWSFFSKVLGIVLNCGFFFQMDQIIPFRYLLLNIGSESVMVPLYTCAASRHPPSHLSFLSQFLHISGR